MPTERTFGYVPDVKDARDYPYALSYIGPLPIAASNFSFCTPAEDQGPLGACCAKSAVGWAEYLQIKAGKYETDLSALYVYYNLRLLQHTTRYDSGGSIRLTIKAAVKYGFCRSGLWPYNIDLFTHRPPDAAYEDGAKRKALTYKRLRTLLEVKDAIASGFVVQCGISVYENMLTEDVERTGKVPMPDGHMEGGHSILLVAYDDSIKRVEFKNSWGRGWGSEGFGTLPYDYLEQLGSDFWVVFSASEPEQVEADKPIEQDKPLEQDRPNQMDRWIATGARQ